MEKIFNNATQLIGNTPLLKLNNIAVHHNAVASIVAKLEYFNPAGSVKDRAALFMINEAERNGILSPGAVIIEPTSGNTGVGLAFIAAIRGYRLILTMPETMSVERRKLLAAHGAEIVLTPGTEGMNGAIARANELHESIPGSVILGQFSNHANPLAHYMTTAEEILRDTDNNIDFFVAGVGTGGTVSGTGKRLKEVVPSVQIIAVEPASSAVLSGKPAGIHGLQGIGAGFIPETYDPSVIDHIMPITDDEAFSAARDMASLEGLLVGISSGAALAAAVKLASQPQNAGKRIITLLPDTGERYLSTSIF